MQSLKLDFLHPLPRPHWSAWVLLAAGLGLAVWAGWQGRQAQRALDQAVASAPKSAKTFSKRATRGMGGEAVTAAQSARQQLAVPWDELLVRLESSRPKTIALVALEADARKTEATLTAEARTAEDMLAYIELLKGDAGFASVTLASHVLQDTDPQQPLRFVLRLVWRS